MFESLGRGDGERDFVYGKKGEIAYILLFNRIKRVGWICLCFGGAAYIEEGVD
jgi:hypothetical protein